MKETIEWPHANEKREEDICFTFFVAAALIGLCQFRFGPISFSPGNEMVSIARNLAEHGSYANPEAVLATGPTALSPPLYPCYLALLMKITRSTDWFYLAASLTCIVANAFTASWLPRVSRVFYGSSMPGIFGAVLWLASMILMPSWDGNLTQAGLLLFCLFTTSSLEEGKSLVRTLTAGILASLLYLSNPGTTLIIAPWIAYLVIRRKASLRQASTLSAVLFLVLFLWAGRNYLQLGTFAARTGMGISLNLSNNDCAQSSLIENASNGCDQSHQPNANISEAQLMRSMGEAAYDRKRGSDAMSWINSHPKRFSVLCIERFRDFWFPPFDEDLYYRQENLFYSPAIWLATALSIPGLALMIKRREPVSWFVLAVLIVYPAMYYVNISDVRYRYPVLWLSFLPAGYFLCQIYFRFSVRRTAKKAPARHRQPESAR
jgi:cell shape-determining protein MreD